MLAALRSLGRQGLIDLVERDCAHARRMAERLAAGPHVRILNEVVLNQVLVRFDGTDEDPDGTAGDARTRAVIDAVQRDGTCWLGGTTWAGRAAMRVSVSGWQTTGDDIERSADAILACVDEVDGRTAVSEDPGRRTDERGLRRLRSWAARPERRAAPPRSARRLGRHPRVEIRREPGGHRVHAVDMDPVRSAY